VPANGALISATSTANSKIAGYMYVNPEPAGPTILTMTPSPLPVGNDTITITASASKPFVSGATALCGGAAMGAKFISPTTLTVQTYVASYMTPYTCTVTNPGTMPSNALSVPVGGPATPAPVVSPATANVGLGSTQQFSATNATSWKATYGTITSAGLYTAPAATTPTGTDTITATGPGGTGTATVTLLAKILVSPATATAVLGSTVQFTAANATSWSATSGTVTSAGLYTAPTSMPASGTDTVQATGPGGTGTAIVTLQNYPAPTISAINPTTLPLGMIAATISGTGFTPQSTVTLGGTPLVVGASSANSLTVSGFAATSGPVNLVVSNGSMASAPLSVQVGIPNAQVSAAAARRFLEQAAFGPTTSDAANVQTLGYQGWLGQQFAMPQLSNYNALAGSSQGGLPQQFLVNAVTNPDQLRQRVAFALSQIFVTSINTIIWNGSMVPYEQMLMADSFTNYRQILEDVTLSPTMGQYLNMANNAQADPATGTVANENYAREVMQLFTIGLWQLNDDGSQKLDGSGNPIPTYSNTDVEGLAAVFTGWSWNVPGDDSDNAWSGCCLFSAPGKGEELLPMQAYPSHHYTAEKQFLGVTIAPQASPDTAGDLKIALDTLFNHPNLPPFFCKQMIQHMVTSNPSPTYIGNCSAAFENDGTGTRGNLKAVISEILTDPEARDSTTDFNNPQYGKVREALLRYTEWARAFTAQSVTGSYNNGSTEDPIWGLGEMSLRSPTVFNWFAPGFVPPGTTIAAANLVAPEMQMTNVSTVVGYINYMQGAIGGTAAGGPDIFSSYETEMKLAATPTALMDRINLLLMAGEMDPTLYGQILDAVSSIDIPTGDQSATNAALLSRVQTAIYLTMASPSFCAQF